MKEIKAIIRPIKLDAVLRALHEHPDFPGVTVSEVRGFGKVASKDSQSGPAYGSVEMTKLVCIIDDEHADEVAEVIQSTATTGRPGDGQLVIRALESVIRIRTGDRSG
jgi:nitrogen regulatory protein P-II 1